MNSANKNIDFWIYFSQRECWNCGIMGPQHGNPIYQISTYSGLCCVVKSRQDFHLNIKIYWQKLRDKNKTTRLSYYLCAMVLNYYCFFLSDIRQMQSKTQAYSVQKVNDFQLNIPCLSSSEIKSIKFQFTM